MPKRRRFDFRSLVRRQMAASEPPQSSDVTTMLALPDVPVGQEFAQESLRGLIASIAPSIDQAYPVVQRVVGELSDAHAVDEGTGNVLDPVLDAWVDQWHNDIDAKYAAWESLLQLRECEAAADVARHREYVRWVERDLRRVDQLLEGLGGPAADRPHDERRSANPDEPDLPVSGA